MGIPATWRWRQDCRFKASLAYSELKASLGNLATLQKKYEEWGGDVVHLLDLPWHGALGSSPAPHTRLDYMCL